MSGMRLMRNALVLINKGEDGEDVFLWRKEVFMQILIRCHGVVNFIQPLDYMRRMTL